ncbi:MAG: sulfite exporter TauE/SafE family protein [Alistipes sp.]|nr:sulfite exporter TauE/SafE family protein [Alistipes sp.]
MDETAVIWTLVLSGVLVGIINTLAGGGAVISMTLFMALGLPIGVANGTNRIAVVLQNFTSSVAFLRKRMLNVKSGIKLSIPAVVGNIVGSIAAMRISETIFTVCMTVVMSLVLIYMITDQEHKHVHIHGGRELDVRWWHYLWFLLLGFYGGYIYIGLGYVLLAVTIWSMKLDIITANVVKCFIIFVATPFSLAIFMINGQVDYVYGLWHGLGNVIGALLASHFALVLGAKFVRYFTLSILVVCFADIIGLISLHDWLHSLLTMF